MWLLETDYTGEAPQLKSFLERDFEPVVGNRWKPKRYAILSHRWEAAGDEVDFDGMRSGHFSRTKPGWLKIRHFLHIACKHGFKYAWVDTCCIDKRSSAELQESINSM